jgi:Family of unknown function (DUF6502)
MAATLSSLVLDSVLQVLRPLVRLLVRHGITYTVMVAALKKIFLEAARDELAAKNMAVTDSALSLLSGVHRRDVRNLTRLAETAPSPLRESISVASQLVARWMSDKEYLDESDNPVKLPRSGALVSFDELASAVSRDVRPRAVLDELVRLGLVSEQANQIELLVNGFIPRTGFTELAEQFRNNLADHASAASANLHENRGFLEQAIFVDQLSEASAHRVHQVSAQAWRQAFRTVMREAQSRFDHDAAHTPAEERTHRARFGVYFYSSNHD